MEEEERISAEQAERIVQQVTMVLLDHSLDCDLCQTEYAPCCECERLLEIRKKWQSRVIILTRLRGLFES